MSNPADVLVGLHDLDTPPLSGRPSEEPSGAVGLPETDGSPSAVASAEAALILRFTHLQESLPKRVEVARITAQMVRDMRAEMAEIERLLRAHRRLREPIKRRAK